MTDADNALACSQFHRLTEDDLAPEWYEPEKPKKRKASASLTKELEKKKKKTAPIAVDEDDLIGINIPVGR